MQSLFWMIVSNTVVASLVALTAWVAGRLHRPALAHVLWLLVVVKLVTPPIWRVPVAIERAADAPAATAVVPADHVKAGPAGSTPIMTAAAARPAIGAAAPKPAPRVAAPASIPAASAAQPAMFGWSAILLTGWTAGSVIWLAAAAARVVTFRRILRLSPPADGELQNEIAWLSSRLGLARAPGLRVVDARLSPMIFFLGVRAPQLVLPRELLGAIDADQRQAVLTHELIHLRRGDHWVRLLEALATALLWWHPLLWAARRGLGQAEEQCCDAWVVDLLPHARRRYADVLVDAVQFISRGPLVAGGTGFGHLRNLKRRLTMIVTTTPPRSLSRTGRVIVAGLLFALPLAPVPASSEVARGAEPASPISATASSASAPVDDTARAAVLALLEAAQDQEPGVRNAAVNAIVRFGDKAVPALIETLSRPGAAPASIDLLSQMGTPAVDPLLGALKSEDAAVRRSSIAAIEKMFGQPAILGGFGGEMGMMDPAMMPPAADGSDADAPARRVLEGVVKAIGDSDVGVRRSAARLIGQLGKHDPGPSAEALLSALKDSDVQVRRLAAGALSQLAAVEGAIPVDALAKATTDADTDVRLASLGALAAMGAAAEPAMGAVTAALRDPEPAVRAAAAEALGAMQSKPGEPGGMFGGGGGGFGAELGNPHGGFGDPAMMGEGHRPQ